MRRANLFVLAILFSCAFLLSPSQNYVCLGEELGFLEEFVLAEDREQVLKRLVPGTEAYYYYHALHHQNNQELARVDELLVPWVKRFGESNRVKQIRHRQALLKYSENPKATLAYLTRELRLNFNHQRRIPQAQRDLPTKLNPNLISIKAQIDAALRHSTVNQINDAGLRLIADRKLSKTQRRNLLERLRHPDYPGLVDLIIQDLKERDTRGFGQMRIHGMLTLTQLDDLAAKHSKIKTESKYVDVYLGKLYPSEDVNWGVDRDEHRAYLERLWRFVKPLNDNFNSLKACVLFRRLELDRVQGKYDRAMFMEYLKLPRSMGYVNPDLVKNVRSRSHIVNLNADYAKRTMLLPIRNDEPLIRDYLHYFLLEADQYTAFTPYVRDSYLKQQFATVKILNGIGDSEKWASMLSPEAYKQLLERIDIDFLSTNPEHFGVDDPVELELHLKNVENLIVKVFEINTQNYYRKYQREIDTDVNLDGLVPNFEEVFNYREAPALRKKRTFKFPQIKSRGVFIVDFIAGGKSSRALIRKGRLQVYDQVTPAGQVFTVVDQSGAIATNASLWIAGNRYNPIKDGKILVPFSTQPRMTNVTISQGEFACLQRVNHVGENYDFKASLVLDRENLTRGNTARVLIRPSLQIVGGNPVPVSMLEDTNLVVSTTNHDGVAATKTIRNLKLSEKEETIVEFMVPPRTKNLSVSLSTQLKRVTTGKKQTFNASKSFAINGIDNSDQIQDLHLVPTNQGYYLEMLGKSGEVRPKQAVRLEVHFAATKNKVYVDLQTDDRGLIELGELTGVRRIDATPSQGTKKSWLMDRQDQTYYSTMHALTGEVLQLPAPAGVIAVTRDNFSLLQKRRGTYVSDHFESVLMKNGLVVIDSLEPGDYELKVSYDLDLGSAVTRNILIRVTDGPVASNVLIGKHRHLETRAGNAMHLSKINVTPKRLRVELDNTDEFTRVHVLATRYMPTFNAYREFAQIRDLEPWTRTPSLRRSVYMEGRKIGDEYEYILRRKYDPRYPGNMLQRPSLLLNPWATKTTNNNSQTAADGNAFGGAGNAADKSAERGQTGGERSGGYSDFANLDYLGSGSAIIANLKPNKDGVVTVDLERLGANQHVRVIALNALHSVQRTVELPLRVLAPRDARLAHSLDPDKHFSQSKQTNILMNGDTVDVDDVVSAKFQQYDDLGDVFKLYQSLNTGTHLSRFQFILTWSDKTEKEKRELYSRFACHELNFFIMRKDREFFESVVVPHLENKRDKTFMDHYLLGNNLDMFVRPWNYNRLNVVEKILLSQRLEGRSNDMVRHINEMYAINPTPTAQFDHFYDTTLFGLGLDSTRYSKGVSDMMDSDVEEEQSLPGLAGGMGGLGGGGSFGRSAGGRGRKSNQNAPKESAAKPQSAAQFAVPPQVQMGFEALGEVEESESINSINGRLMMESEAKAEGLSLALKKKMKADAFAGSVISGKQVDRYEMYNEVVPVTRMRRESRSRRRADGSVEKYYVEVPYTENVTRSYARPLSSLGQQSVWFDSQMVEWRDQANRLYRRLDPTQEWMENNYYLLQPGQFDSSLVMINRFWRDFANHSGGDFLSAYFAEANRTFTEQMFALAVLDLPLKAPEHKFEYVDKSMKFTSAGPSIVLHQQVRDAILERGNTTILVSENFFQKNDRYRYEDNVRYDKFITGDFLAHTLYGGQVVITNPTSTPRTIELLIQIPRGSVACSGSQETRTVQIQLGAYSTQNFEYSFYFPTAGDFSHYPAHVSAKEKVLAVADPVTFKVIDRPAELDKESWEFVSQNGTNNEVIEFLNQKNVLRLNLAEIAFRMKDQDFFRRAIRTLRNRYAYDNVLWSYSIKHHDVESIKEYLSHSSLVSKVGRSFASELLKVDPVERDWYAHKEYWPLVNSRAHQLGPKRKILNPDFYAQYNNLLGVLVNRRELNDDDHLVVTYYLLLQDRIESALEHFDKVNRDKIPSKIQYDYCDAYLDMYREQPDAAAAKAEKWASYPVDHWRNRFEQILAQVEEIRGGTTEVVKEDDNAQVQTDLASKSESFDFEIESGVGKLKYQNLETVEVNYYEMDIELLFSRSPFAQDEMDGFSLIRPNFTQTVKLKLDDNGKGKSEFKLPKEMMNKNVLVEVVAGDQTKSLPYFAHSLDVQMIEKFGQVHVTDEDSGKAISKVYVKVYSRLADGSVRFHKDGYTDLRGRFDYVSQSNTSIDNIQKFAVLVLSDENGAVIRQASKPKE